MAHGKANLLTFLIILGLVAGTLFGQFVLHTPKPDLQVENWLAKQCDDPADAACMGQRLSDVLRIGERLTPAAGDAAEGDDAVLAAIATVRAAGDLGELAVAIRADSADVEVSDALDVVYAAWRKDYVTRVAPGIDDNHWTKTIGDLSLIRPLKMLIIPLVFVSVVCGVCSIGDPSRLGVVGGSTLVYYLSTMLLAVVLGATLVTFIEPGDVGPDVAAALQAEGDVAFEESGSLQQKAGGAEERGLGGSWLNILMQLIPDNLLGSMVGGNTLGVIFAALGFGLALAAGGDATAVARDFFNALFDALMRLIGWIIWMTPVGVFMLLAWTVGKIGIAALAGPLGMYVVTVLVGLLIHGAIVLPLVLWIFARTHPFKYMWKMRRPLFTAFGIDSSSATLPVTIQTAQTEGECSKRASNFVLPLGATVNMDGTALYEAVAVVFLFQLYGIDLSMTELLVVVITATLAAIGAAGIPSAGLVTMVIVITAVNASLGGDPDKTLPVSAIAVILGIDRIVDMCRTTVNVWGDAVGAKIITRIAPDTEDDYELAAS